MPLALEEWKLSTLIVGPPGIVKSLPGEPEAHRNKAANKATLLATRPVIPTKVRFFIQGTTGIWAVKFRMALLKPEFFAKIWDRDLFGLSK